MNVISISLSSVEVMRDGEILGGVKIRTIRSMAYSRCVDMLFKGGLIW